MSLVHRCSEPGCQTLTMGTLCLEHERAARAGAGSRRQRLGRRIQTPVLALALAVVAAMAGRHWARVG
jgi:hypothetical protein